MKKLYVTALAIGLTACAPAADKKNEAAPIDSKKAQQSARYIAPDKSVCDQGVPATRLEGRWGATYASENGFTMLYTFEFRNGQLTLSSTCSFGGRSVTTRASTPIAVSQNQFRTQMDAHGERSENGLSCYVDVERADVTYSFKGSCLEFHDLEKGQTLTLVPAP